MPFSWRKYIITPAAVNHLINQQAGLLGISGISSDMQGLLTQADTQTAAALAVDLFCYQVRKFVGALAAALGGLDTFVFTGGISENSATIRARLCAPGISRHPPGPGLNEGNAPILSRPDSPVTGRVIKTNEELMIARQTRNLISAS